MKKVILLLIVLSSFLMAQALTKGWSGTNGEDWDVPIRTISQELEIWGGTPGVGKVLTDDGTGTGVAVWTTSGAGEANTASNQGTGIGVFDNKNVLDLEFRSLVSQNNRLTIGLDVGNKEIDFTIVEANIDHDALANFLATEHFIQSAIIETGALNAGSIANGFGAIDVGASSISTTGITKTDSLKATGNVDIDGELTLGANARYPVEGYSTGRNVRRHSRVSVVGQTDATTVQVNLANSLNGHAYGNEIVDTDTPTGGTNFDISADGKNITIKGITETTIGVRCISSVYYNTIGTAYTSSVVVTAGKVVVSLKNAADGTAIVLSAIANTKIINIDIIYFTST